MSKARVEAETEFKQARRLASRQQLTDRLSGRDSSLLPFETIRTMLKQRHPLYRGVQQIPVDKIVGSVGRYREFNRSFLPLSDSLESRWVGIHALASSTGWPPIEAYQVGNVYFVKDGNHRASVARAMGLKTIEATVWEFPEDVIIGSDDSLDDVLIRLGERAFMEATRLDVLRPGHGIRFTTPGRYTELLTQIEDLQAKLSFIDRQERSYQEAVEAWYDLVYLPVTQIIHEANLLEYFPGRTVADLFAWLSLHRDRLIAVYDLEEECSLQELAQMLVDRFAEGGLEKLARQVRRLLGQEAPPPWRILDAMDATVTIEYEKEGSGEPVGASAASEGDDSSMLLKTYTKTGSFCRVTFKLPADVGAQTVHLVGDFNDWDQESHPMKQLKDGSFSLTISLPADQSYRFRYLLDGKRWENDWAADAYVPNVFGGDDSLVEV